MTRRSRSVAGFDLSYAPGHLLRRCNQRSRELFDELIGRRTKLSRQQVALLIVIHQSPGASQAQLSSATGFDRVTLADTVGRLVKKGLVVRRDADTDARAYRIELTPQGAAVIESLIPAAFRIQERILEPLPGAMRPLFIACMRVMLGLEDASALAASRARKKSIIPRSPGRRRRTA